MRSIFLVVAVVQSFVGSAEANDRLPRAFREGYRVAGREVREYTRYILRKVFVDSMRSLHGAKLGWRERLRRAAALTDEVVQLLLPQARRITRDVLFGTGATYVRFALPERRAAAVKAARSLVTARAPRTVEEAVEQAGRVAERNLNDRIDQAILEDLEDYTQQWVEGAVGLPLRGRGRGYVRPLPKKWEQRYQGGSRKEVHGFLYWWLRKRRRLSLTYLATALTRPQIDAARHQGPVWRLLSGISQEAWAQNRLRMDFKWGRLNWQIDRRRIRRRMDQDLAEGTWAMARLVKELMAPQVQQQIHEQLQRRVREELSKEPLRREAERYPETRRTLTQRLQGLKKELDPIFNGAMDKVPLPPDMPPDLQGLAREHGRRFMREELDGPLAKAIRNEASALSASRRVREKLPGWVADALVRFDPGRADPAEARRRAQAFAQERALPRAREEVREALRDAGRDDLEWDRTLRGRAVEGALQRAGFGEALRREVDRQFSGTAK